MKTLTCSLLVLAATSVVLHAESPEAESELWTKEKQGLYSHFEKLVLPPKGTSTNEIAEVFLGGLTEIKATTNTAKRLFVDLYTFASSINDPRLKMQCQIDITVVDGKVAHSNIMFLYPQDAGIASRTGDARDHRPDYKLSGILNGYLRYRVNLSKASWNKK
jgi:hypothetical protein